MPFICRAKRKLIMAEETSVFIGALVILFFIWRFVRTHQLYRFSIRVLRGLEESTQVKPSFSKEFFNQVILGNRCEMPKSFFVRAFVFVTIALLLFPFKDYAPDLYLVVAFLIILYIPWCVGHGILLRTSHVNSKKSVVE